MGHRSRQYAEAETEAGEGQSCSRGDWCRGRVIVNGEIIPAVTPRTFCEPCTAEIAGKISELPAAWVRARAEIAQSSRSGSAVRAPFGPRLPGARLGDVDAVLREITECLLSWDERIRAVGRLSHVSRTRGLHSGTGMAVRDAAALLGDRMSMLLALDPAGEGAEMRRFAAGEPVTPRLGGAAAGLEALDAHRRALRVLGEIRPQAETLDGVPCKHCEDMSLERAEPPSDPAREAMWSRCASCLHMMTRGQFDDWAGWYSGWADRAGLTCRRCAQGRHDECCYERCGCLSCAKADGGQAPSAAA